MIDDQAPTAPGLRPRVLFVMQHLPVPVHGGSSQRSNLLIDALRSFAEVDILAIGAPGVRDLLERHGYRVAGVLPTERTNALSKIGTIFGMIFPNSLRYRARPDASQALRALCVGNRYDVVIGRYCRVSARAGVHTMPRSIIDIDDLESQKLESWLGQQPLARRVGPLSRWIVRRLRAAERRVIGAAGRVWLSAGEDGHGLSDGKVDVVPNIPFYPPAELGPSSSQGSVLFVASFDYRVNLDALEHLVDRVWPAIHRQAPHLTLRIVGGGLDAETSAQLSRVPGVSCLGFVDDLTAEYARAVCSIVPIWEGGGTKIKILESLALGRTCVVAAPSLRGYADYLRHDRDLVVADDDTAFAAAVVKLAADDARRHRLETAGRAAVVRHFSRTMLAARVRESTMHMIDAR